ncbi:MAG: Holliday junction DNA helicase RuvB C-terminal domain-containing protein, partial [Planctomycetaceae bacterium]
ANNLLSWVRDFAMVKAKGRITKTVAEDALTMQEVDALGLEEQDRKYLTTIISIFAGGPAGVQAIGHSLNIPVDTLEDEVEPFLLRLGLIQRTPRGRVITAAGLQHLGMDPPPQSDQGSLF